ncbi:MAG: translocation/assembly module TamB, partial [Gramella sp.]|nr:translocation/assembly module TamB [Christiangramia sp.]
MSKTKQRLFKILRILGKIFLGILIFLLLIILFVRSPWGQNIIKEKVISSVEKKTGGNIDIERLFIQFDGDIQVDNLLIEDPDGDTVVFAGSLSANIPFLPLIKGNSFSLEELDVKTLKANISRVDSASGFNYEFLTRPYAGDTTQTNQPVDTTSAPMDINIGALNLQNFDIVYKDGVSGIDTEVKFDLLELELTETDLEQMVFRGNAAILENAVFSYEQTKPFPESESEAPPMPVISIEDLKLRNVKGSYNSQPDSLFSNIDIASFELINSEFNLKDQIVKSETISLSESIVSLKLTQNTTENKSSEDPPAEFEWPDWNVAISEVNLQNNELEYFVNDARVKTGVFDPNALKLDDFSFLANDISYVDRQAKAEVKKLQFNEASGMDLEKFNLNVVVSNEETSLSEIELSANNNKLTGNLELAYRSI